MVTKQTGFRLPEEMLERLGRYVEKMKEAAPGMDVTLADAVRVLLTKALDAEKVPPATKVKRAR